MRKLVLVLAVGCGGGGGGTASDASLDRDAADRDSAPGDDGPSGRPFVPLASRAWSAGPLVEGFFCVGAQLTEELWISGFRPIAPPGTYNLMLSATDAPQPEGPFFCDQTAVHQQLLFSAGVGTGDLVFPEGTAIRVQAGKYVVLQVHVHNPSTTDPLSGESSIHIQTIPAGEVTRQAEVFFTGTFNTTGSIPADSQPHPVRAGCGFPSTWQVLALMPRMHQYGTAITLEHRSGLGDLITTFVDGPFSHDNVQIYPINQTIPANDSLEMVCTYVNTSGSPVGFGEITAVERCLVATYVAPAMSSPTYFCMSL